MGGKLGVTPPVRIQQPATCISTNETLILERVNTARQSTLLLALWFFPHFEYDSLLWNPPNSFLQSIRLSDITSRDSLFPTNVNVMAASIDYSENLRNFGDESWNSNWQKVKDEAFWSDAPSTWLHLTIRRRSVDALFRLVKIVTRRSKGRSGGPRCTPPPPGQLSRTQPCLLLPWNKYLMTSQPHFLWS